MVGIRTAPESITGLTSKQERFSTLLAQGLTQYEAYRQSYNVTSTVRNTVDSDASQLAAEPKIAQRVAQLKQAAQQQAELTIADILRDLLKVKRRGLGEEAVRVGPADKPEELYVSDHAQATKALELLGKHLGMFQETVNVNANVRSFQAVFADMSVDQLKAMLVGVETQRLALADATQGAQDGHGRVIETPAADTTGLPSTEAPGE